jgi:pimeloyl-ACP methyl ester carboxylesterase
MAMSEMNRRARSDGAATRARLARIAGVLLLLWLPAGAAEPALPEPRTEEALDRPIEVPFDRDGEVPGSAVIHAELGAPFDRTKPVLLVIADAQQFYVRRGAVAALQKDRFGDAFNVVGIIGRGATPEFVTAAMGPEGTPDWERAWRIFSSSEWVEDIEAVRRAIAGPEGKVLLYGQSGGAFLVHQYLAVHGRHVARAATPAPLNPFLVGELGLNSDRFWDEVGASDPELQVLLRRLLESDPADRGRLAMTLQRQNFFVPPEDLAAARAGLIRALASGDDAAYRKAREDYQVEQVRGFLESAEGIPIRVRLYEFFLPSGAPARLEGGGFHPDLENQRNFAAPLLELRRQGRIPAPGWDRAALHRLDAEVLILAGVRDHTVDYRASVALAFLYPNGLLFLADDDHQSHRMQRDGTHGELVRSFLASGSGSPEFRSALAAAERHRWREP